MAQHLGFRINNKQARLILRCLQLVKTVFVWPSPGRQRLRVSIPKNPVRPEWLRGKHFSSARQESTDLGEREMSVGLFDLNIVQMLGCPNSTALRTRIAAA